MRITKNIFIVIFISLFVMGCGDGYEEDDYRGGDNGDYYDDGNDYNHNGAGESIVRLINSDTSTANICEVYSNPSTTDNWGPDRLSGVIPPGYHRDFSTHNCNRNYDLKVVFCDGWEAQERYYRECGVIHKFVARNW